MKIYPTKKENAFIAGYPWMPMKDKEGFIKCDEAEQLVLKFKYDKVYTSEIKSNGGNSAKISCPKQFIGQDVVVFILKKNKEKKNGKK